MSSGFNHPSEREWLEIKQVVLNLWTSTEVFLDFHWIDSFDCSENLPEWKMKRAFGYSFNYWIELQEKSMSHSFKFAILVPALGLMKPVPCLCYRAHLRCRFFSLFPYRWIATIPSNCKMCQQLLLLLINCAATLTRAHWGAFEGAK